MPKEYLCPMERKPSLVLFTHEFPFGNSETSFLEPELPFLQSHFNLKAIVTFSNDTPLTTTTEKHIAIIKYNESTENGQWAILKAITHFPFLKWLILDAFKALLFQGVKKFKIIVSQCLKYQKMALFIHQNPLIKESDFFYSYWFDHWSIVFGLYQENFKTKTNMISRAHRYEIDKNTAQFPSFPFERIQLKKIDLIAFISEKWRDNFIKRNFKSQSKSKTFRMGVNNFNQILLDPSQPYKIVTISGNIPVKRLSLQAEAMNLINLNIEWHHFGADQNDKAISNSVTNPKIKYINHGFVPINQLLEWLEQNPQHFLISTSIIEGVPVSMMECIARGIPIIGLDVGGVSEIINDDTGILCNKDVKPKELAEIIENALVNYRFTGETREKVRTFQQKHFNHIKNYTDFCQEIRHLK